MSRTLAECGKLEDLLHRTAHAAEVLSIVHEHLCEREEAMSKDERELLYFVVHEVEDYASAAVAEFRSGAQA